MPQKKVNISELPEKTQKLLEYHAEAPEWDGKKTQCFGYTHKQTRCQTHTQGRKYCWRHSPQQQELNDQYKQNYLDNFEKTGRVGVSLQLIGKGRAWLDTNIRGDVDFANAIQEVKDRTTDRLEATAIQRALGWDENIYDKAGNIIGTKHVYSDRLMEFMLKARRPETFRETHNVNIGRQRETSEAEAIAALMQPGAFQALNDALTPELVQATRTDQEEDDGQSQQ
jgi:hypothetical protein